MRKEKKNCEVFWLSLKLLNICLSVSFSFILFAGPRNGHVSLWHCSFPPLFQLTLVFSCYLSPFRRTKPFGFLSIRLPYPRSVSFWPLFCFYLSFYPPSFTPIYTLTVHFVTFFCNLCLPICGQLFTIRVLLFIARGFFISFFVPLPTATIKFSPSCRKRCSCTAWASCIHAVIDLEMLRPSLNIPCTHTNSHEKWRIKTQACRR